MAASRKALKEWKERYEAFRQYCAQYLVALSIAVTGLVVGLVFAMSNDAPFQGRLAVLAVLSFLMLGLMAGHIIARRAIAALGARLRKLENELGFEEFQTSQPLESGLKVTLAAVVGLFFLVLVLFILVAARVI